MADSDSESHVSGDPDSARDDADETAPASDAASEDERRRAVEEKYDFENFGPEDMAEMSLDEWETAFDPDSWITGPELLDRAEADLLNRIQQRDVFAVVERIDRDGEEQLLAYSDEGYAIVYQDGSVEGEGTILRDVKPTVALASMDDYEVPEPPTEQVLPDPEDVPEGSGELGNRLMMAIAAVHVLAGVALVVAWVAYALTIVAAIAGLGFFVFGLFVFLLVANARLSDRFRAEEYRDRLRAVGFEDGEPPEYLPLDDDPEDGQPE